MFLTRGSDAMFRVNKCESGIMHRPDSRRYDTVQQRLTELTAALEQAATTLRGGYQAEQISGREQQMQRSVVEGPEAGVDQVRQGKRRCGEEPKRDQGEEACPSHAVALHRK